MVMEPGRQHGFCFGIKRLEEYKLTLEFDIGHLVACLGAFIGTAILISFNDFLIILERCPLVILGDDNNVNC